MQRCTGPELPHGSILTRAGMLSHADCARTAGALLKEAVEDLEWSSGSQSIALYIKRNPPQITLCAQGLGELLIALPVSAPPFTGAPVRTARSCLVSLSCPPWHPAAYASASSDDLCKNWGLHMTSCAVLCHACV